MKFLIFLVNLILLPQVFQSQIKIKPYLLPGNDEFDYRLTWFTEDGKNSKLKFWKVGGNDTIKAQCSSIYAHELDYSQIEEDERTDYPDTFKGTNWKHSVVLENLSPSAKYSYVVRHGNQEIESSFFTAPKAGTNKSIRFITMADSETEPDGRRIFRKWPVGNQYLKSTGRPKNVDNYLLSETEGFKANLELVEKNSPDFILLTGDIVQGGGYQKAWDEFFFHTAGKFNDLLGRIPLVPAIGNWENYGAKNGKYEPAAIRKSRAKYKTYFSLPDNGTALYQDAFYRTDYGPVTIITLDSSNGLPDNTDADTNVNINISDYPERDIPDINPGSVQWNWALEQLEDAREKKQIIFVQFHHIPYSSGGHILPLTADGSSGQAGIPMRKYTQEFKKYGVIAVFCGHNEMLEHSVVEGVHFWDVGIAGDGFGITDDKDIRKKNEYSKWTAHKNSKENWNKNQLISGGKHYGHLVVDVMQLSGENYEIIMTPHYVFPILDKNGSVIKIEDRKYDYEVKQKFRRQ